MEKKYTIKISDNTGHTELMDQSVGEAVSAITEKVAQHAHWVWVDGQLFEFDKGEATSPGNQQKLRARLEAAQDQNIVLSGTLVGGSK